MIRSEGSSSRESLTGEVAPRPGDARTLPKAAGSCHQIGGGRPLPVPAGVLLGFQQTIGNKAIINVIRSSQAGSADRIVQPLMVPRPKRIEHNRGMKTRQNWAQVSIASVKDLPTLAKLLEEAFGDRDFQSQPHQDYRHRQSRSAFLNKLRSAVVTGLSNQEDPDLLQKAWNMIQTAKDPPFKADASVQAPLPRPYTRGQEEPGEAKNVRLPAPLVPLRRALIDDSGLRTAETELLVMIRGSEKVQRTMYAPGAGKILSTLDEQRKNILAALTMVLPAEGAERSVAANVRQQVITRVISLFNLTVDGLNKAQNTARVWKRDDPGNIDDDYEVERSMAIQMKVLADQVAPHTSKKVATLFNPGSDRHWIKERS